jgi:YYY domain-containing protein
MPRKENSWIYDVLLIVVLAAAAFLRLQGADWGELQHQHPDELFLTSVVANLRAHKCIDPNTTIDVCPPEQQRWMGLGDYFNSAKSTLNPYNRGFNFFVYGTLPLFMIRYTAEIIGQTDYTALKLLGRQFSALVDLGTIFLLYLIVAKLYNRRTALLAAAFSAFAVMQIQQSHFFTTDSFINLFAFLAIYFAVGIVTRESGLGNQDLDDEDDESQLPTPDSQISNILKDPFLWLSVAFGFSFGLAMASKVSIFPLALLLPGAFAVRLLRNKEERERFLETDRWKLITVYLIAGGLAAFIAFRIFQPYAFDGFLPSEHWLANIAEQRVQARGDADLPWNLQWARRTHLYSFKNLTIWGLGLPLGILAWAGFLYMGWRILKGEWKHALLWGWTAFYFIWQSLQFNPTMRYQLPIYPLLAMMAAWGVTSFARAPVNPYLRSSDSTNRPENDKTVKRPNWKTVVASAIGIVVLIATAAWAYAFHTIYTRDEPRMAASRWIYQNVPGPINVRIQTPDGDTYNQPLAFFDGTVIQPEFPYETNFLAQRDGTLTEIALGHVVDPAPPESHSGPQTLTLTVSNISTPTPDQVLAHASLTQDFPPGKDMRGEPATLTLDRPLRVSSGQLYFLRFETDQGLLTFTGSAVANETDYDYGLPFRIDGYDGFGGIYRGDLNFQVYWDDNADKLARFTETLKQADYIFIPTSHQYAQITRLPERYPLTTVYYRELLGCPPERDIIECYRVAQPGMFKGNLGFDLVAVFESYPRLGPIVINDQAAEEAFTFYDHPKVLIFKKSADYNPAQVATILGSVDLTNVVHLTPRDAATYKNLMLPADQWARQRAGGTWSDLFDYDWLQNKYPILGLVIWYLFVFLLGVLTYPIIRLVLPGLGDKGYPLARTLGLVILAYVPWALGSLGVAYSRVTIGLVFAAIAVAGLSLGWLRKDELAAEWKSKWRHFLMIEGLFLSFFVFDLLIRLGNPDLWHPAKGGERPMDFSYLNAILKSTTFPPYDPWFAGGYINYYYYGFVLVGTPVKLLGIVPSIAYNFILPTLFAIVATSAFSIGWNLVDGIRESEIENPNDSQFPMIDSRFIAGLSAAILMVVVGNLGTVQMVFQAFARIGAPGGVITDSDFFQRLVWAGQGVYQNIAQGVTLPIGRGEWYWNPSRVIPPGPGNEITEFPFFTFLYSDLHAHMIVLILALFVIAWALGTVRARRTSLLSLVAGALAIGALYPTNLSDIYTYLPLGLTALAYALWRASDSPQANWLPDLSPTLRRILVTFLSMAVLTALSLWLYAPYRAAYSQAYSKLDPWTASHTPFASYLTHWGLFLFLIFSWLVWETRQWMAATPVSSLQKLKPYQLLLELGLAIFIVLLLYLAYRKVSIGWIAIPLAAWAGILLLRPKQPDMKRLALFWIGTALIITVVVELFTVRGDIGRMNTIFKFYLQAWTLLAVSCGAAFAWMLAEFHTWPSRRRNAWQTILMVLFASALLYTITATVDKVNDRINPKAPRTLDSMTYMAYSEYWDTQTMDLSQDYQAIRWMQDNVQGSPVITETNCPEYRWCTRFTIYTGLPGVVGWNWHQRQQRALIPPNLITDRIDEIAAFYTTTDINAARAFLAKYDVRYFVVGQLEGIYYPGDGLAKFEQYNGTIWKKVYHEAQTTIYEVIK